MSALQVEKLEGLLARIQDRRHPRPTGVAPHPSFDSDEPITSERAAVQKAAAGAAPAAFEEERPSARASKPTPMEQALEIELESTPPPAMPAQAAAPQPAHDEPMDDEPVVEIMVDDDEPEIIVSHDEPELDHSEQPTAPLGTRAPAPLQAQALEIARPGAPAGPVARVVDRPAPRTFGELLERTLRLRPR